MSLFHDSKSMTISPSKGKAKEDDHWNVGWWEFHSLVEQPRRPVEWSDVSVIFTAHPSQPMITGRHFSSTKSFVIQPQSPKINSVTTYAPPSLIVCSAGSEWLFAYFPGIGGDGLACIWKRGAQIDVWAQRHVWNVPRNAGVVAAHWAGAHREWTFDAPSNQPKHLPPMGPRVPVSNPALFLVTQDRRIHVWFIRVLSQHFQCIHLPLNQPGQHAEDLRQPTTQSPPSDPPVPPGGMQLCTHATIGTTYNEPSLLIATRSCVYPVPSDNFASADLNMSMGLPPSMPDDTQNWASFGEKDAIEITEVQLAFNTIYLVLAVNPLGPLHYPHTGLTQLRFLPSLPSPPADSSKLPVPPGRKDTSKGDLHLAVSSLDFSGYVNTPKSSLSLYHFSRGGTAQWKPQLSATRSFESSVLAFVLPQSGTSEPALYAGLLATYGSTTRRKNGANTEAAIGSIVMLQLSDLREHPGWESSPLVCPLGRLGRELPLNAAVSPNHMLAVTVTSGLASAATTVHVLPNKISTQMIVDNNANVLHNFLSQKVMLSVLSGHTSDDVTQYLALPATNMSTIVEVLNTAHTALEDLLQYSVDWEVIGILIEIYRVRSQSSADDLQDAYREKFEMAHDMASLAACCKGFDLCNEGDLYDLSAVWQLIGMATWVVNFVEKLLKECVLCHDMVSPKPENEGEINAQRLAAMSSPIFLHLVHPFSLTRLRDLVHHINHFHKHLNSISVRGENALIAKTVLDDLIAGCGIGLKSLETLLNDTVQDANNLPGGEMRRCLDACEPSPAVFGHIRKVLQSINTSSVLNKPRLFLKPLDLVDSLGRLSLEPLKGHETKDVVSKGLIPDRGIQLSCVRCRGKAALFSAEPQQTSGRPPRWRLWEKSWEQHCICWGSWSIA